MHRPTKLIAAAIALLTLSAGCSGERPADEEVIVASPAKVLPDETPQDLVTYGDRLVEFTAVSEFRVPPYQEEIDRGEGLILRKVNIKLDQPKWTRPEFRPGPALPTNMTIEDGGWVFHGNEEIPLTVGDSPKIEVGKTYLAVMTRALRGEREPNWFILEHFSLSDGVVRIPNNDRGSSASKALAGQSVAQVARSLVATPPDPKSKPYMFEDPLERWEKVSASR